MIRFAYPNAKRHHNTDMYDFIGCGRFAVFGPDDDVPQQGYRLDATDPSTILDVRAAASILAPESDESPNLLYEIKDNPDQDYWGESLNLVYLFALIHRSRSLRFGQIDGDIWCTGTIAMSGKEPLLKSVSAAPFEEKLRAFLSKEHTDPLFIVPDANITQEFSLVLKEMQHVGVCSLKDFSVQALAPGQKTILKVRTYELPQLIDTFFVQPALPQQRLQTPQDKNEQEQPQPQPELDIQKPLPRRRIPLREILIDLALGLLVFGLLLLVSRDADRMQYSPKAVLEQLRQVLPGAAPASDSGIPLFAFIEIDDETYEEWGKPDITPRDNLLKLIEFAVDSNASLLLVDIDLQGGDDRNLDSHDQALYDYVDGYSASCRSRLEPESRCPQIIFVRNLHWPSDKGACPDIPSSFLDQPIADSADIHWAIPSFIGEIGGKIHEQWVWEPACSASGKPEVVPAMSLLAAAFAKQPHFSPKKVLRPLEDALWPLRPTRCQEAGTASVQSSCPLITQLDPPLSIGTGADVLRLTRVQQRILFRIPWKKQTPLLSNPRRAKDVLYAWENRAQFPPDTKWIEGRIVILGGSFHKSGDIHRTPSGEMPGALIILNGIHSLLHYGELSLFSLSGKFMLEGILLLIMSCLCALFPGYRGISLSGIVLYGVSFFMMSLFFRASAWWIFALPLFVGQLRHLAAEFRMQAADR